MTDKTSSFLTTTSGDGELMFAGEDLDEKDDPSLCAAESYNNRLKNSHISAPARSDNFMVSLNKFIKRVPPEGTIVDIGCGVGIEVNYFTLLGFHAYGIDISEEIVRLANENFKELNIVCGNLLDLPLSDKIKINAIFEHLSLMNLPKKDINEYIGKVYKILKPEGVIQVSFEKDKEGYSETGWYLVPCGNLPHDGKEQIFSICKTLYLSYFTEEELRQLFETNGFKIVDFDIYKEPDIVREIMTLTAQK